jgi:hypothetical protein
VSTAFGSLSVYGYGIKESFNQTPVEQFYASDSEHAIIEDRDGFRVLALDHEQEFHLLDRGTICNFYRLPYTCPLPKENSIKNALTHWVCSQLVEAENHRNELLFFNNFKEVEELQLDVYHR